MNKYTNEQFIEAKTNGEALYKSIQDVYCPYLKEKVYFNAGGLEHLAYKNRERLRTEGDQYMRFKLMYLVPIIIHSSHTLQGIRKKRQFVRTRIHSRTENVLKEVTYYEFIAVINRNRLKIVVKQVENGQKFFWSIIPFWGMDAETRSRILHDGDPEED